MKEGRALKRHFKNPQMTREERLSRPPPLYCIGVVAEKIHLGNLSDYFVLKSCVNSPSPRDQQFQAVGFQFQRISMHEIMAESQVGFKRIATIILSMP